MVHVAERSSPSVEFDSRIGLAPPDRVLLLSARTGGPSVWQQVHGECSSLESRPGCKERASGLKNANNRCFFGETASKHSTKPVAILRVAARIRQILAKPELRHGVLFNGAVPQVCGLVVYLVSTATKLPWHIYLTRKAGNLPLYRDVPNEGSHLIGSDSWEQDFWDPFCSLLFT